MNRKNLNLNKTLITVIMLNIIQILSVLGIIVYSTFFEHPDAISFSMDGKNILFVIILLSSMLNSFFTIRDVMIFTRSVSEQEMLRVSLDQVEDLNKTLRAQRHDFMNHLQVVYSLIELDEYTSAKDYIDRVYSDIRKVSRILKTSNAAINALLQAKFIDADKKGIHVSLNVTSQYKDLPIPSWEMCRVLGNLIDNSIYALMEKSDNRQLIIELFEDLKSYGFRITNNGPSIPESHLSRIFEAGFTTKGNRGEGLGLSIVKDTLSAYNGKIDVISNEESTCFEGFIPKQDFNQ